MLVEPPVIYVLQHSDISILGQLFFFYKKLPIWKRKLENGQMIEMRIETEIWGSLIKVSYTVLLLLSPIKKDYISVVREEGADLKFVFLENGFICL